MNQAVDIFKGKKVLLAGGTGTIGIPLGRKLVERGAIVTVASLDSPDYARKTLGDDLQFTRADLTDYDMCLDVTKHQDFVFNLVGIKGSIGIGTTKAATYFVPVIRSQTNLMEAAYRSDVNRYLFVSSICAYPPSEFRREDELWNGMPAQDDRYGGLAKRIGEIQGETYLEEHGWDAVRIVRPSNVYGPFDDFNPATAQVIPALIRRALDGESPLKVWGDGSAVRDFIFSEDLVEGMLLTLEKAPACLPINLGSGRGVTIKDLAETVARSVPGRPDINWDVSKPTGDSARVLSSERAQEVIGFLPKTSLEQGIQKTVDWYLANTELANLKGSGLDVARRQRTT